MRNFPLVAKIFYTVPFSGYMKKSNMLKRAAYTHLSIYTCKCLAMPCSNSSVLWY